MSRTARVAAVVAAVCVFAQLRQLGLVSQAHTARAANDAPLPTPPPIIRPILPRSPVPDSAAQPDRERLRSDTAATILPVADVAVRSEARPAAADESPPLPPYFTLSSAACGGALALSIEPKEPGWLVCEARPAPRLSVFRAEAVAAGLPWLTIGLAQAAAGRLSQRARAIEALAREKIAGAFGDSFTRAFLAIDDDRSGALSARELHARLAARGVALDVDVKRLAE